MKQLAILLVAVCVLGAGCAPPNQGETNMPAIVADFDPTPGQTKIEFECSYEKGVILRTERGTLSTQVKLTIPADRIPESTADYTRHLIMRCFFSDPTEWRDGYYGMTVDNYKERGIEFSLCFRPLEDYCQKPVPKMWDYVVSMSDKPYRLARHLVSEHGHILYPTDATQGDWEVGYIRPARRGVYLDIIDDYNRRGSENPVGRVTEYFFRFGTKSLEKLRAAPKRVEVMPYLNDYFDGRFHLGKERAK